MCARQGLGWMGVAIGTALCDGGPSGLREGRARSVTPASNHPVVSLRGKGARASPLSISSLGVCVCVVRVQDGYGGGQEPRRTTRESATRETARLERERRPRGQRIPETALAGQPLGLPMMGAWSTRVVRAPRSARWAASRGGPPSRGGPTPVAHAGAPPAGRCGGSGAAHGGRLCRCMLAGPLAVGSVLLGGVGACVLRGRGWGGSCWRRVCRPGLLLAATPNPLREGPTTAIG